MQATSLPAAFAGIDVGKDSLELAIVLSDGKLISHTLANAPADQLRIVALCQTYQVALVVMEATGGLELDIATELASADLPVKVITPAQSKAFAGAMNQKAKTDAIDAKLLAAFARCMPVAGSAIPSETQRNLKELAARRRQLIQQLIAEKNHLGQARHPKVKKSILKIIGLLKEELAEMDDQLGQMIQADPQLQLAVDRIASIPGIGKLTAVALVVAYPEIGTLNRRKAAALGGLAPYNRDSGKTRGPQHIRGGRPVIRTTLYMATMTALVHNPVIKVFYQRLVAAGKPRMVALTAAMRKLLIMANSLIRAGKSWSEYRPQYA